MRLEFFKRAVILVQSFGSFLPMHLNRLFAFLTSHIVVSKI